MDDIAISSLSAVSAGANKTDELRLRLVGQGAPIIFSHGAGFACDCFAPLVMILARSYSVYLLDLVGHGVNPPISEEAFSLDLARDQLRAACIGVAARHDGAAPALVCHSISSVLALRVRAETPQHLSALVAYEPPLAQPDSQADVSLADQSLLERRALGRRRTFAQIEDLAGRYASRGGGGLSAEAAEIIARGLLRPSEDGYALRCAPEIEAKIYRTNQHFGLWARLGDPGPPVTIMAGRRRGASDYTADVASQIAEAGSFDLIRLAGLSHLGWAEAPARTAPFIRAALAGAGTPNAA